MLKKLDLLNDVKTCFISEVSISKEMNFGSIICLAQVTVTCLKRGFMNLKDELISSRRKDLQKVREFKRK